MGDVPDVPTALSAIVIMIYLGVAVILYIVYIAAVEAANRRLSRAVAWWRWYHGYAILGISLSMVTYVFWMADYEPGIFANLPGLAIGGLFDVLPDRGGATALYLLVMLASSLAAWLLVGATVQLAKGTLKGFTRQHGIRQE